MNKDELKKKLTPGQYNVCFLKGTEPPGSGKYLYHDEKGIYKCVVCNAPLFDSAKKFKSGHNWPSFEDVKEFDSVKTQEDRRYGMIRTEVLCANCGSHLGHVFPYDKSPTGKYFCINSLALDFEKAD